jgi:hypothetical protein
MGLHPDLRILARPPRSDHRRFIVRAIAILRSRALLVLGSGYLFTATITVMHAVTFPGLFTPSGLLGGSETTSWLYASWKFGFVCFLLAYALLKDEKPVIRGRIRRARVNVMIAAALVLLAVCALTVLASFSTSFLPTLTTGDVFSPASHRVSIVGWIIGVIMIGVAPGGRDGRALWR